MTRFGCWWSAVALAGLGAVVLVVAGDPLVAVPVWLSGAMLVVLGALADVGPERQERIAGGALVAGFGVVVVGAVVGPLFDSGAVGYVIVLVSVTLVGIGALAPMALEPRRRGPDGR